MPRTRQDWVNEALMDLGIVAAGQTADAEDFDAVDGKVDGLVAWLEAGPNPILNFDDPSVIPDEWFNDLAVLLADRACYMFGLAGLPVAQNNPNPVQKAIDNLRFVTYSGPTFEPLKAEYF
jgi:hypothetical protein